MTDLVHKVAIYLFGVSAFATLVTLAGGYNFAAKVSTSMIVVSVVLLMFPVE